MMFSGFNTLWIYTALKPCTRFSNVIIGFNTLWIYTALKQFCWADGAKNVSIPSEFTLLSNNSTEGRNAMAVSIPSEFTLLSNTFSYLGKGNVVSIPSEFTLLSNRFDWLRRQINVSIPSEFTLLSNHEIDDIFIPLFQYPLNLHCSQTKPVLLIVQKGFNTLWIYTALKHKRQSA